MMAQKLKPTIRLSRRDGEITKEEIKEIVELVKKVYDNDDDAWKAGSELDGNYLDYLKTLISEVKRLQNELTIKTPSRPDG